MQSVVNSQKVVTGLGLLIIFLYAHLTIGQAIARGLLFIRYSMLVLGVIGGLLLISWGFRRFITELHIEAAKASQASTEAEKSKVDIRSFKKDEQVYQIGVPDNQLTHALHLEAKTYSNGVYQPPTQQELLIFQQFNQNVINNYPPGSDDPGIIDLLPAPINLSDSGWINDVILKAPHIHLCGPTQSGKTTLGKLIIEEMQRDPKGTEFYLINPKHLAYKRSWPLDSDCKEIDDALTTLKAITKLLKDRITDESYNPATYKNVIIIVDEWDWIFETHGNKAVILLRQLIKVGAELNFKVILVGQSPLTKNTGLSGSDYHNMVRVAIWAEGEKLLNALPIAKKDKAPHRAKIAELKSLQSTMPHQIIRYAFVIPLYGDPSVQVIPHLGDFQLPQIESPVQSKLIDGPVFSEEEQKIIDLHTDGFSASAIATKLYGDKNGRRVKMINTIIDRDSDTPLQMQ